MTLKENDPVVIYETGEVGYIEKILDDEGDRLIKSAILLSQSTKSYLLILTMLSE